nr:VTT domain-containing protein [Brevibacterium yomogidense]
MRSLRISSTRSSPDPAPCGDSTVGRLDRRPAHRVRLRRRATHEWRDATDYADGVQDIQDFVISLVGSPWLYPVFGFFIAVSAAIPPIPSSALIVALGAVNAHSGAPDLLLLLAAGTAGSIVGDHVMYLLGRRSGFTQWPLLRSAANQRRIGKLSRRLAERGLFFAVLARFIPLGRTLIALVSGDQRWDIRRWLGLTTAAGAIWAAYSIGFGWLTARWIPLPMWAAVAIAVGGSFVLGAVVSRIADRVALGNGD